MNDNKILERRRAKKRRDVWNVRIEMEAFRKLQEMAEAEDRTFEAQVRRAVLEQYTKFKRKRAQT